MTDHQQLRASNPFTWLTDVPKVFIYRVDAFWLLWTVCFRDLYWQWHPWLQGHTWTHFKPENVMCNHHITLARNSIAAFWLTQFKVLYLYLHVEKFESCNTACDKVFSLSVIAVSSKIWCHVHISYVFCLQRSDNFIVFVHIWSWNYYIHIYLWPQFHYIGDGKMPIIITITAGQTCNMW